MGEAVDVGVRVGVEVGEGVDDGVGVGVTVAIWLGVVAKVGVRSGPGVEQEAQKITRKMIGVILPIIKFTFEKIYMDLYTEPLEPHTCPEPLE